MKKKLLVNKVSIPVFLLVLLVNSCSKDDNTPVDNNQSGDPIITAVGTPSGVSSSATIGSSGGTVLSADGNLTMTIPADALTTATELSIQPISNEAPLGLGNGYRLLPEGVTFLKPVQLVFHYNDELLQESLEDFLWIVSQASDGSWNALLKSEVDKTAKTVTIETTHFSDWALGRFIDFTLTPSSKTILKGQSVQLSLSGFSRDKALEDDDELAPLIPITGDDEELTPLTPIPPIESRLMDFRVKQWTMNGAAAPVSNSNGSLSASGKSATYTAPNKRPSTNPVAVTVELEANNKEGAKSSYMITSSISVVESNYYLFVKVDGQSYEYYQYGYNGAIPPDPNNIALANCGLDDNGILSMVGMLTANGSDFINGFALAIKNPSETTRSLVGFHEDGDDDITFQIYPSAAYMLDYTKYTYDAEHEICNTEYLCSEVSVTIFDYQAGANSDEVRGYFSGILYEEENASNWEQCKTPDTHTIEGEFWLVQVN